MPIDYEMGERDLKTAEEVNAHVEAGTLPDRIPYDNSICGLCDFDAICQPISKAELEEVTPEQIKLLNDYLELEQSKKDHSKLRRNTNL